MATILEEILKQKRKEIIADRERWPLEVMKGLALGQEKPLDFYCALKDPGIRIIAECKRQSPSRGVMVPHYDPISLAKAYERGGAAAISVLTDEVFFGGHLDHLADVRQKVKIPVLRKDFIVDEYQIFQARARGADSFLLLASVLDAIQIQYFIEVGRDLGMEALVEVHDEHELDSVLATDARLVGVIRRCQGYTRQNFI